MAPALVDVVALLPACGDADWVPDAALLTDEELWLRWPDDAVWLVESGAFLEPFDAPPPAVAASPPAVAAPPPAVADPPSAVAGSIFAAMARLAATGGLPAEASLVFGLASGWAAVV
ncbi:MAG: hypothetical protein OEU92_06330 [Alphaproteobacteria bacterium]|nr:hypothetical protein [Alphaproteobacteria bacterium]